MNLIRAGERVDQFTHWQVRIIQSPSFFTLSVDAILLADFIRLPKGKQFRYIDFCSGNGVIPLLLTPRTEAHLEGIELHAPLIDMARRSAQLNQVAERVHFMQMDLNDFQVAPDQAYDIISCNPPYFVVEDTNAQHHLTSHALARHEITLTLDQWIQQAARALKDRGRLFFVHRPDRMDDIMEALSRYGFAVHRLCFVHPKLDRRAKTVLVEAIYRGGRRGVRIEPPIVVHTADDQYTSQMQAIYDGRD